MSSPTRGSWKGLVKLGKYLKTHSRSGYSYPYQDHPKELVVWTDTDYAGCKRTRKSTSGGVVMWGKHLIKSWSSTQTVVALSSGEAEYYGAVRGASQVLGLAAMLRDMGIEASIDAEAKPGIELCVDASAAVGIASRRGLGKQRHIELNELWLQDQVARGRIAVRKVDGRAKFSDSLTKFCNADRIAQTLSCTGQQVRGGRRELMPALS